MTPQQFKAQSSGTKILITVFLGLVILSIYFIVSSYYSFLNGAEKDMLSRLRGISNTLALHINAEKHEQLMRQYKKKDAISESDQDILYQQLHKDLKAVQEKNNLSTPVYTLVHDRNGKFYFGVTSAEKPYFRHEYKTYPKVLKENYDKGGVIPAYEDEHGVWLSAFAPVKNRKGKVVAVVQTDMKFDNFIQKARQRLWNHVFISFAVVVIIGGILIYYIRGIWKEEEQIKQKLQRSKHIIQEKNKNIMSSMRYASRIQQAIFDRPSFIHEYLPDSFVLNKPRDMVSGDFFWCGAIDKDKKVNLKGASEKKPHKLLVAIVDCTGHGVPGALMSVIGFSLLNEIVLENHTSPADMLKELNLRVIDTLKQDTKESRMHDGMDIAMCAIDKQTNEVEFAGANRPLYYVNKKGVQTIKGDPFPIGGMQYDRHRDFTNHKIKMKKDECIYFCSDGYVDQFGGPKARSEKFKPKRLRKLLKDNYKKGMDQQYKVLDKTFEEWKNGEEQIDDVAFIGIKL